jgi:hypothetical protein
MLDEENSRELMPTYPARGDGEMKKKVIKVKKLQLSRETLLDLKSSDAQEVLGGNQGVSCQSQEPGDCCTVTVYGAC